MEPPPAEHTNAALHRLTSASAQVAGRILRPFTDWRQARAARRVFKENLTAEVEVDLGTYRAELWRDWPEQVERIRSQPHKEDAND